MIEDFFGQLLGLNAGPEDRDIMQVASRAIVIFAAGLLMLRVAEKRAFARRNRFDLVVALILASTLSRAINGSAALIPTIAAGFALILVHRALNWAACRWHWVSVLLKGNAEIIIEDGVVRRDTMSRNCISTNDLLEDLRLNGVEDPRHVLRARLERSGEMSVVKRGSE